MKIHLRGHLLSIAKSLLSRLQVFIEEFFVEPIYYQQKIPNSLRGIYVREGLFERLQHALTLLPEDFSLLIYDGYRPFQVQQYLFSYFFKPIGPHSATCYRTRITADN
ncbi:hypothetical protein OL548_17640 [Lysinibacillus sp. MHQ-1]|nr:hypothetical protein OL548_17640 [Lysinibacillus sp. MHQ-1]